MSDIQRRIERLRKDLWELIDDIEGGVSFTPDLKTFTLDGLRNILASDRARIGGGKNAHKDMGSSRLAHRSESPVMGEPSDGRRT